MTVRCLSAPRAQTSYISHPRAKSSPFCTPLFKDTRCQGADSSVLTLELAEREFPLIDLRFPWFPRAFQLDFGEDQGLTQACFTLEPSELQK